MGITDSSRSRLAVSVYAEAPGAGYRGSTCSKSARRGPDIGGGGNPANHGRLPERDTAVAAAAGAKVKLVGARKRHPVTGQFVPTTPKPKRPTAPPDAGQSIEDDADEWTERAVYWEGLPNESRTRRTPFGEVRPEPPPLVLNGHGIQVRVQYGALVVKNGYTHYPQENPESRFFPGDRNLPSRFVLLESDGSITFDALTWLAKPKFPVVQARFRRGMAAGDLNQRLYVGMYLSLIVQRH